MGFSRCPFGYLCQPQAFSAEIERSQPYNDLLTDDEAIHWSRAEYWSNEEAASLSLNRDPRRINHSKLMDRLKRQPSNCGAFVRDYADRYDLIFRRGFPPRTSPRKFLAWFDEKHIELPGLLIHAVNEFHPPPKPRIETAPSPHKTGDLNALGDTERQTFLKIILGMAIEQYGYVPDAARNKAVSNICEDLVAIGLDVTDDTIRAKLKDAVDRVLPFDWRSRKS